MAEPAPKVEAAIADAAHYKVGPAIAEPAIPAYPSSRVDEDYDNFDVKRKLGELGIEALPVIKPNLHTSFGNLEDKLELYSKHKKGVSVDFLRPAEFESRAAVIHYDREVQNKTTVKTANFVQKVFHIRNNVAYGEVSRYVVIKEGYCFIFLESTDLKPLYTFELNRDYFSVEIEDREKPDPESTTINPTIHGHRKTRFVTVLLRYTHSEKIAYQFTFDDIAIAAKKSTGIAEEFFLAVQSSMNQETRKLKEKKFKVKEFRHRGRLSGHDRLAESEGSYTLPESGYSNTLLGSRSDFDTVELSVPDIHDDDIHPFGNLKG